MAPTGMGCQTKTAPGLCSRLDAAASSQGLLATANQLPGWPVGLPAVLQASQRTHGIEALALGGGVRPILCALMLEKLTFEPTTRTELELWLKLCASQSLGQDPTSRPAEGSDLRLLVVLGCSLQLIKAHGSFKLAGACWPKSVCPGQGPALLALWCT